MAAIDRLVLLHFLKSEMLKASTFVGSGITCTASGSEISQLNFAAPVEEEIPLRRLRDSPFEALQES
jgi:hypothetical protein